MIHIAVNIDDKYSKYCAVLLISILENNKNESMVFHILCDQVKIESKDSLISLVKRYDSEIRFYDITNENLIDFPVSSHWPLAIYYRLLIPTLLSNDIHKILYLDCDIVVKGSIKELWETDIQNYAVAAVEDELSPIAFMIERLGYDPKYKYFNSGVILVNLEYWRKNNISESCFTFISKNTKTVFHPDQDALNAILHDKWFPLEYRWNYISSYQLLYYDMEHMNADLECESFKFPVIIHFTGKKPWDSKCRSVFKEDYFKYQLMVDSGSKKPKHSFLELIEHIGIILLERFGIRKRRLNYKY